MHFSFINYCYTLFLKISYSYYYFIKFNKITAFGKTLQSLFLKQFFFYPFRYTYAIAPLNLFTYKVSTVSYKYNTTEKYVIWWYTLTNYFTLWYTAYFMRLTNFYFYQQYCKTIFKQTVGDGFFYIRGLLIIFCVDGALTDDEPIWEPLEWSLVQTWILFIFIFAWIAENLITSRFGSYTGRDKRVWFAWYKTFWLLEFMYLISYGVAALFVMVPFYFELTYHLPFIFCWWHWYTRVFFFKFISLYSILILVSYLFQLGIRWLNWKKLFFFVVIINIFVAYLLYTSFMISFFGYFTDPVWYQKTRGVDYVQLSHEPLKWGWGTAKRDHFTYHRVSTIFWFKSDGPFAGAFLMFHLFFFIAVFFLYLYWVVLLRRLYVMQEASYTFSVFVISTLKQFYYFFLLFFIFILFSFVVNYWRFPMEFWWTVDYDSWWLVLFYVCCDYFMWFVIY